MGSEHWYSTLRSMYTMYRDMGSVSHLFTNVVVDTLKRLQQPQVHGLLGQNAIDPPPRAAPARRCATQSVAVGASAVSVSFDDACEEPEGHQGEGFIDGTHLDYMVEALDTHSGHKFNRLLC